MTSANERLLQLHFDLTQDWGIVIGVVDASVGAIPHIWFENNGYVFDPSTNETMSKEEYCSRYDAIAIHPEIKLKSQF